ncbi:MAG TPA: serine hydrolase [Gemmatimonas aurantiaca]|uniref:Beta-lactamase family protein n=2 Tax=Gemmatimonas aurantiaca TaxID=173480 RepID=C1A991_GEMAT|nr:serine hydrolase [Gemmatimonas aurantiaca]BAH39068.1 beta-lactamase family protein [Gemmatimonas aurantiaca T-27]HCT57366.1 serine hydrolase [Gemmatimonas aurantiaca]
MNSTRLRSFASTVRLLALLAALALPMAPAAAQRDVITRLDTDIATAVKAWKTAGLAVSIVRNDSVLLAKGYGLGEIGKPTAVDADTRFAIGSTTKAMTSLALGMLVDEGKVRWDAPVIEYLPAFKLSDPWVTRELTIRDILTHRAGLGNADLLWTGTDFSTEEILRRIGTVQPAYSFRSGWIYQNIMYAVAGAVVEAASGQTWDAFLEQRLFAPLGMNSTITRLSKIEGKPNVASPHGLVNDSIRLIENRAVDPVAAAGSVWSSVNDMAKWMRFVLDSGRVNGKRLVSETTFRTWLSPQVVADPATYPALALSRPHFFLYGLGWFLQDYNGQAVAMHTGSIDGMSAIIGLIPDKRLGVYVLANTDHVELRHAIMYEVFDRLGGAAGAKKRDWSADLLTLLSSESQRASQPQRAIDTKPSLPLASYVATYRNPTYGDVVITLADQTLHARFGNLYDGDLSHWQYETFRARWTGRGEGNLTFRPDGTGRIIGLQLLGNTFTRIAPAR